MQIDKPINETHVSFLGTIITRNQLKSIQKLKFNSMHVYDPINETHVSSLGTIITHNQLKSIQKLKYNSMHGYHTRQVYCYNGCDSSGCEWVWQRDLLTRSCTCDGDPDTWSICAGPGTIYNQFCPVGTYQPTYNADGWCKACPSGQYQSDTYQTSCKNCAGGKYADTAQQSSCKQCPGGYWSSSSGSYQRRTSCKECPTGQFATDSNSGSWCTSCQPGFYQDQKTSLSCKGCPVGWYQNQWKETSCKKCPAGKITTSSLQAQNCDECTGDDYQDEEGKSTCKECPLGRWSGGDAGVTYGTQIADGKSCFEDGLETCVATGETNGPAVYYTIPSRNRCVCPNDNERQHLATRNGQDVLVCQHCAAGLELNKNVREYNYNGKCEYCPPGKYSTATSLCTNCPQGYYTDNSGNTECTRCDGGYTDNSASTSNTQCKTCPSGKYSWAGCNDCRIGTYNDVSTGVNECKYCPGRSRNSAEGAKTISSCDKCNNFGYYCYSLPGNGVPPPYRTTSPISQLRTPFVCGHTSTLKDMLSFELPPWENCA